jgi:hypothetical protein
LSGNWSILFTTMINGLVGDQPAHRPVTIVEAPRLDHEKDDIDFGQRLPHALVHHPIQRIAVLGLKAGRIDKDVLRVRFGEDAHDAVTGRLRPPRDDAHLFADQRVEQRRLADVRAADDGDQSGYEDRS